MGRISKPVIGLSGGIGSGKSAVGRILQEFGAGLIDSDRLGHQALLEPDVVRMLHDWWGPDVIDREGRVDRAAVGKIVFADSVQKKRLEELLHPRIARGRQELKEEFNTDARVRIIVIDAPLLHEAGVDAECDCIIFVDADRSVRERRVQEQRRWTADELDRRENLQISLDMKRRRADHIVSNNSSLSALRGQVEHLVKRILALDRRT